MTTDFVVQVGRDALMMVIMLSAPMLGIGLLVGVMVSIFQATTQIQEQTLAFVPKVVAVFVSVIVFGPWMLTMLVSYVSQLFMSLPDVIR